MHKTNKEEEVPVPGWDESNRSFDSVNMKSLTCNSLKLVKFTILESSSSKKITEITDKIDTSSDGNLVPFRVFITLFCR